MESAGLPGLCIYTKDETAEISVMGATRTVQRDLDLVVEGYAKTANNLDDTLDQIGKELEVAMAGDIATSIHWLMTAICLQLRPVIPLRVKPRSGSFDTTIR